MGTQGGCLWERQPEPVDNCKTFAILGGLGELAAARGRRSPPRKEWGSGKKDPVNVSPPSVWLQC